MNMLLEIPAWVTAFQTALENIINPILILVAVAGMAYAIVVGVKFAKADDKAAREEAKQKLITVIIGIVVTALLIGLFTWLKNSLGDDTSWIASWFNFSSSETATPETTDGVINFLSNIVR